MKRPHWRWVKKKKEMCRVRDGDTCLIDYCMTGDEYRAKFKKDFDLHHIDENIENMADDNLCLAAHKCNVGETQRGKGKFNHERIEETQNLLRIKKIRSAYTHAHEGEEEPRRMRSVEFAKSEVCKPIAEDEVVRILDKHGEAEKNDLINAMANISGLSTDVCRKYLGTYTNPYNGHLEEFDKDIGGGETKKYIRRRPE